MQKNDVILVVGHGDIVDCSLIEDLRHRGFQNVYSSFEMALDTTIQPSVYDFFQTYRPKYVVLTSIASGGIEANRTNPADFLYKNCESQNNVLYASWKFKAIKVLFVGSSCVYPKDCSQPMKEDQILSGPLEPTSEPYSIAKISGLILSRSFRRQYDMNAIACIPATVYGPGSSVELETAHVMGALIKKISDAHNDNQSNVELWGSGKPRREFLFRDDFVSACIRLLEEYDQEPPVNIAAGSDISIKELAELIANIVGFNGEIRFDSSKPDGVMQKKLDGTRLDSMGFKTTTSLEIGIRKTIEWYLTTQGQK